MKREDRFKHEIRFVKNFSSCFPYSWLARLFFENPEIEALSKRGEVLKNRGKNFFAREIRRVSRLEKKNSKYN